ncbi:MAG: SufB/SufD family protein [bacterium]|jgi:Fe-S cluster assembly scaffold protein SufB
MLNATDNRLLETVADLHAVPAGAFNIRKNGESVGRSSTANIDIIPKADKPGIDVIIKPGTRGESVHIPVILTAAGLQDMVYNTFDIGAGADVTIVAGCGIHNPGDTDAEHNGIHTFIIRPGARVRYIEKHYGEGTGKGQRILNPKTIIEIEEGGRAEMEMVQIRGVDNTIRETEAKLAKDAFLLISERLLTHGEQYAESKVTVNMLGAEASAQIISRSVAQDKSRQLFYPRLAGYSKCRGHVQCDSIIMQEAQIRSIPEVAAYSPEAQLIHEAAIGKIAGEQIVKLMTLGLTEQEAEDTILQGFLK